MTGVSASLKFRGLMAPVFTPFNNDKDRSLNLQLIPEYARYMKQIKVEGILVNGTTGEGVSQTVEEREQTAEAWATAVKETGHTLMIQVGGTNLKDVRRLAAHAERIGASSILCLADLFHRPNSADDLIHYLKCVGEAAPKTPLLYYHIPGFTGININVEEMLQKADRVPTLVGLKFTSPDLDMGARCLAVGHGKYVVFLGSDTIYLGALALGFDSAIGTTLNMVAAENQTITEAVRSGDRVHARKAQQALTEFIRAVSKHGSWVGTMKAAMNLMTPIKVGPARDPLLSLNQSQLSEMTQQLRNLNLVQ